MDPRTISDMKVSRIRAELAGMDRIPESILAALKADRRAGVRALAEHPPGRKRASSVDMLAYERRHWQRGATRVAGVDEAGRGPLAGPVCAAAVILPVDCALDGVNDSKSLTHEQRIELLPRIEECAVSIGIELIDHTEIDRINILQAAMLAMRSAISRLDPAPELVLVDGNYAPGSPVPETTIVKGDARSLSIAAASIVAKVTRDRVMLEADTEYPGYGFAQHKGYYTRQHIAALRSLGPCPIHRRSFAVVAECEGKRSDAYWLLKDAIDSAQNPAELHSVGEAIRDQLHRITSDDRDLLKTYYRRRRIGLSRRDDTPRSAPPRDDAPPPDDAPPWPDGEREDGTS